MQETQETRVRFLGKSPGIENDNLLQYPCPGESHEQRSLVGYSSWVGKELDTTEHIHRLAVHVPNAGGLDSIPGQGTRILHAAWCGQK